MTSPCDGDWIFDGRLTFFDIAAFVRDYNEESPKADLDRSGSVSLADFDRFISAFISGCP
ncbi:MAG: GC-type dockerin domain-anchored protein [Phycisphaerales bacterium]